MCEECRPEQRRVANGPRREPKAKVFRISISTWRRAQHTPACLMPDACCVLCAWALVCSVLHACDVRGWRIAICLRVRRVRFAIWYPRLGRSAVCDTTASGEYYHTHTRTPSTHLSTTTHVYNNVEYRWSDTRAHLQTKKCGMSVPTRCAVPYCCTTMA